eukprot:3747965-Pyramimonas_sp.AAC.1
MYASPPPPPWLTSASSDFPPPSRPSPPGDEVAPSLWAGAAQGPVWARRRGGGHRRSPNMHKELS